MAVWPIRDVVEDTATITRRLKVFEPNVAGRRHESVRAFPDANIPVGRLASLDIPAFAGSKGLQVLERIGGDDGTRTRGLCRDRAAF